MVVKLYVSETSGNVLVSTYTCLVLLFIVVEFGELYVFCAYVVVKTSFKHSLYA